MFVGHRTGGDRSSSFWRIGLRLLRRRLGRASCRLGLSRSVRGIVRLLVYMIEAMGFSEKLWA